MRPLLPFAAAALMTLAVLAGCRSRLSHAAEAPAFDAAVDASVPDWVDGSPHLSETVDLDGVHLAYLDWGGIGPALVMVHGLGGNPHVFDDLAPLLRDHLHVLAYARRGEGDSDRPLKGPYDQKSLADDLGRLLDGLHIDRANLLALSTGGNEITRFAAYAPTRVGKLVYLDAAYDWSDPTFLGELEKAVAADRAGAHALSSLDSYRGWFQETWLGAAPWTPGLEAYLRDRVVVSPDGRVAPRSPGVVQRQLFDALGASPPPYGRVAAPALALYASSFFAIDSLNPGRAFLAQDFERRVATRWRAASIERARREFAGGVTIGRLAGTNQASIAVRDVESLAATIDQFLTSGGAEATGAPTLDAAAPAASP
jgi:pimeloyl-ACP methyl ester carboxylesterase